MSSRSLYDTFGNETKYQIVEDTLVAYLENATIKFPLPEASSEILSTLLTSNVEYLNSDVLDQVEQKLIKSGFKAANARAMAQVLMQVASAQNVSPLTYFSVNNDTLKLTVDTYNTINALRPVGNRVNLVLPIRNSSSKYKTLIKP